MIGQTVYEFIDDIISCGGPEKEFVFRNKYYFLETIFDEQAGKYKLQIDEYDNSDQQEKRFVRSYCYYGNNFFECEQRFEADKVFDGKSIYDAEQDIEVLFG